MYEIISNTALSKSMMVMELAGDTSRFSNPGQFINIAVEGCFLRRPISVSDYSDGRLRILYNVVGKGTHIMRDLQPGQRLDILAPLGNGFSVQTQPEYQVLLGGGVGVAPLPGLAKALLEKGVRPIVVLGFNNAADIVFEDEFERLGIHPLIATVDGSFGTKGFVTDALRQAGINPDYFYACGPLPMLRALCSSLPCEGQLSLEARMACGYGVCMCCSVKTVDGTRRICKDGPVFLKSELIWQ